MSKLEYNNGMDKMTEVHKLYWNMIKKSGVRAWSNDNVAHIMTDRWKRESY